MSDRVEEQFEIEGLVQPGPRFALGFGPKRGEEALDLLRGDDGEDLGATLIAGGEVPSQPGENLRCEGSE